MSLDRGRDPHLTIKGIHHGILGILPFVAGLWIVLEAPLRSIEHIVGAGALAVLGLWLMVDDLFQHIKQHWAPGYRSPVNRLYGKILRALGLLVALVMLGGVQASAPARAPAGTGPALLAGELYVDIRSAAGWTQVDSFVVETHGALLQDGRIHFEKERIAGDLDFLVELVLADWAAVDSAFILTYDALDAAGFVSGGRVITGIQDDPELPGPQLIELSPNPFNHYITITSSRSGELEIYDVAGRRVRLFTISQGMHTMPLTMPAGVYFWRFGDQLGKAVCVR